MKDGRELVTTALAEVAGSHVLLRQAFATSLASNAWGVIQHAVNLQRVLQQVNEPSTGLQHPSAMLQTAWACKVCLQSCVHSVRLCHVAFRRTGFADTSMASSHLSRRTSDHIQHFMVLLSQADAGPELAFAGRRLQDYVPGVLADMISYLQRVSPDFPKLPVERPWTKALIRNSSPAAIQQVSSCWPLCQDRSSTLAISTMQC